MTKISERIARINQIIRQEEANSHRPPGCVSLLAVSKGQSIEKIKEAYRSGLKEFAENYLQEAEKKIAALQELSIHWHFIGSVQSNKTRAIASKFSWIHSIDRYRIAELLNQHRPDDHPPLNVCLQINLTGETSKSGIAKEQSFELLQKLRTLPRIKCRGLMTILHTSATEQEQYLLFTELKKLLQELNHHLQLKLDTLSMGMSNDYISAIHAGSTIIRLGQAIFGEREKRSQQ